MQSLIERIQEKRQDKETKIQIQTRLQEFQTFKDRSTEDWFEELCFCILAANAKSQTSWNIQKELQYKGFMNKTEEEIAQIILKNKHRFHNNKAKYIREARLYKEIKQIVNNLLKEVGEQGAREWLVRNIKGFGYKEASHFLRNTGSKNLAIIDRHVLSLLEEHNCIKEKPRTMTRNEYKNIETILEKITKELKMTQAELDLYLWNLKTNKVLK